MAIKYHPDKNQEPEAEGKFKEAAPRYALDMQEDGRPQAGMGIDAGDVDNDGRPDVFVSEYGRIRLFRNQGDGKFRDVSAAAGIESAGWATSASFVDYDRDVSASQD